jgi:hypothetical protein
VVKLINLNQKMERECVQKEDKNGYVLRNNCPEYCKYFTMPELDFTDMLRNQQRYKLDKIKKLESLKT